MDTFVVIVLTRHKVRCTQGSACGLLHCERPLPISASPKLCSFNTVSDFRIQRSNTWSGKSKAVVREVPLQSDEESKARAPESALEQASAVHLRLEHKIGRTFEWAMNCGNSCFRLFRVDTHVRQWTIFENALRRILRHQILFTSEFAFPLGVEEKRKLLLVVSK
jgi:hypothetical protein